MPQSPLQPALTLATREDVLFELGFSLRYGDRSKPHGAWVKIADYQRLAEHQVAHLERSGFVVMRKPGIELGPDRR